MNAFIFRSLVHLLALARTRIVAVALPCALIFVFALRASAQQTSAPNTAPQSTQPAAAASAEAVKSGTTTERAPAPGEDSGGITEEELKQMLVGKQLFLRGGYLFDTLEYNEHGTLMGRSPHGSYTLCGVEINKVHLTKHKVELEGARYGLHFLGALPYEDPTKAVDWVKVTPKKKVVKITIDREVVIKPKKVKEEKPAKGAAAKAEAGTVGKPGASVSAAGTAVTGAPAETSAATAVKAEPPLAPEVAAAATPAPVAAPEPVEASDADQLKAEIAETPAAERPVDWQSITTTTSPAHAAKILKQALDKIFATGLDDRMMAAMPEFWKLYYQAAAAKTDYQPADPAVLRQTTVDQKAKLMSTFEPESNEYAQANGVAGMALYHAVIGADGKPGEIAVARPIGFGLDENAVKAIRNAKFEPAVKAGKPVPVLLDLVVQFRIYSKRTAVTGVAEAADKPSEPKLPGPYSLERP